MGKDKLDERLSDIVSRLQAYETEDNLSTGVRRLTQNIRSAAGIASGVWFGRRRASGGEISAEDLEVFEKLVSRLGELKGVPMKFGQVLGFLDADLPEEMRRFMAVLQTQSQSTGWPRIIRTIKTDLGEKGEILLSTMESRPVFVASIGQVHRALLPDGKAVAVKVLHPGIEEAIRSDFEMASAGTVFARLMIPGAGGSAHEFVEEAMAGILEECDYRLEAERQKHFGRLFKDDQDIRVPQVHDSWCGKRVLVSSWVDGTDFDSFSNSSQEARNRVGAALFSFYIGTLYRHGLFHADPHPGNYRVCSDGKVVVFDYGCVREFENRSVLAFSRLAQAMRDDYERGIREALLELGAEPPVNAKSFAYTHKLLSGFFAPLLKDGPHRVDGRIALDTREMMRSKIAVAKMRIPGKLLFLARIRFGLYSVLSRIGSVCDWSSMEKQFAAEAMDKYREE